MRITDLLSKEKLRVPLAADSKLPAIRELVEALQIAGELTDFDAVLQAVEQRERTRSTAIGDGLAVPHAKSPGVARLVIAVGKPATPMDFESSDGKPCNLIVLLASPLTATQFHIQALAQVGRLWKSAGFRAATFAAETPEELLEAFRRFEL